MVHHVIDELSWQFQLGATLVVISAVLLVLRWASQGFPFPNDDD